MLRIGPSRDRRSWGILEGRLEEEGGAKRGHETVTDAIPKSAGSGPLPSPPDHSITISGEPRGRTPGRPAAGAGFQGPACVEAPLARRDQRRAGQGTAGPPLRDAPARVSTMSSAQDLGPPGK